MKKNKQIFTIYQNKKEKNYLLQDKKRRIILQKALPGRKNLFLEFKLLLSSKTWNISLKDKNKNKTEILAKNVQGKKAAIIFNQFNQMLEENGYTNTKNLTTAMIANMFLNKKILNKKLLNKKLNLNL